MQEHWREVAAAGSPPLALDYPVYAALHDAGRLQVVTARLGGELVGYIVTILHCPMHYRNTLVAHEDAHFLRRDARRPRAFFRMLQFAEGAARDAGATAIRFHTKARPDINRRNVFEAAGYVCEEHLMKKALG